MTETIRKVSHADVAEVVPHLSRAFDDDPVLNWVMRKDSKRSYSIDSLFRICLNKLSLPHGEVLITSDCVGAALWYPPDKWRIKFMQHLSNLPVMIRSNNLSSFMRLFSTMAAMDKAHPQKNHYYLQFIGVDPDYQGKGFGSALMRPVLEKCDRESCGAYLENSKELNLALYERHGFTVTGEIHLGKDAPVLWPMWRDPR